MAEEPKPGSIVHIAVPARDQRKTSGFYEEVFGWKFQEVPAMNYAMFEAANGLPGGLRAPFEKETDVLSYLLVDSIEQTPDRPFDDGYVSASRVPHAWGLNLRRILSL